MIIAYARRLLLPRKTNYFFQQSRNASCVYNALARLHSENPQRNCIKFLRHERVWTVSDIKQYSEALAVGFDDIGLVKGDVIAIWLQDYVEKFICQLAAAIGGYFLVVVDPSLGRKEAFEKILLETKAKFVLVPENLIESLKAAVPEMEYFKNTLDYSGRSFKSRMYKNLEFCGHTGFIMESGFFQFRNILLYGMHAVPIEHLQESINDDVPLSVMYSKQNKAIVAGPTLTHRDVLRDHSWSTVSKILNKEYVEI